MRVIRVLAEDHPHDRGERNRLHLLVEQRAVLGAQPGQRLLTRRRQADEDGAAIAWVGRSPHPTSLLEAVDEQGDGRLRHARIGREHL